MSTLDIPDSDFIDFVQAEDDYPAPILYDSLALFPSIDFTEKLNLDYRHFDAKNITPRYEFGFGLSYTTFVYSGLSVKSVGDGATVSFTVKNNGSVDGTEIPQLYLGFPAAAGEPPKLLRGFDEVKLSAGQSAQVQMSLNARDLRSVDSANAVCLPTEYISTVFGIHRAKVGNGPVVNSACL
jgi:beta-glucosidase